MNEGFKMYKERMLKIVELIDGYEVARYKNKRGNPWVTYD